MTLMLAFDVKCLACGRESELFSIDPQPVQIACRYCGGPAEVTEKP